MAERYWACGIEGNYLVGIDKKFEDIGELFVAFRKYLIVNKFELGTSYFKEDWEKFKLRNTSYKKDNVIYVDFT